MEKERVEYRIPNTEVEAEIEIETEVETETEGCWVREVQPETLKL